MANDNIHIELTLDEADVIDNYAFKKACKLKDAGLDDSLCYEMLMRVHRKIIAAVKGNPNE